jgi:hypothetical protein
MFYALYNKKLSTYLTLPRLGIWHTTDKTEADNMLSVCQEYVRSLKIPDYEREFSVVELGSEEICQFLEPETA